MKPEIVDGFVIVGDEGWTVEEWERKQLRKAKDRERSRTPERRRQTREASRRWRERHREEWLARHREEMRRYRAAKRPYRAAKRPVASLHDLRCTGPTRATGCRCTHKIRLYARMEEAA